MSNLLDYLMGKRTQDIELPVETRRDPRLPTPPPPLADTMGKALEGYKMLRDKGLIGGPQRTDQSSMKENIRKLIQQGYTEEQATRAMAGKK